MDRLLMIADDITGALDAGVAFASRGVRVCVGQGCYFTSGEEASGCSAVVTVVPTRHVSASEAYRMVRETVAAALPMGFSIIFKKTDSALRGNIGAELQAVLDAAGGKSLCFVPAFPRMGRVTKGGIHYISGDVPVSESVFAFDPFNPVKHSRVTDVIAETSDVCCKLADGGEETEEGICVRDASTDGDIREAAAAVLKNGGTRLLAGCAGMAEALASLADLPRDREREELSAERLLVFCGSVNPISRAQCEEAAENGAPYFHLIEKGVCADTDEIACRMAEASADSGITLFDTGAPELAGEAEDPAEAGRRMAQRIGKIIRRVTEQRDDAAVFVIGGDTLLAFTEEMGIGTLFPEGELFPGVVAASYSRGGSRHFLISKSGGFGERSLIGDVYEKLCKKPSETDSDISGLR